jgi:hypothetical protein
MNFKDTKKGKKDKKSKKSRKKELEEDSIKIEQRRKSTFE